MDNDTYERYYESAMRELNRLRAVVREYAQFYRKIKEAAESQDFEHIKEILEEFK